MKIFNRAIQVSGEVRKVGTPYVNILSTDVDGQVTLAEGATVPTDGDAGYAAGAIFRKNSGNAVGSTVYINEGSKSSADFNVLASGAADSALLAQSVTVESGTYDLTLATTTQTVGTATLTIPDMANVSDTFVFAAHAATLTNKTIDADGTGNTISNINADELDPSAATTAAYGVPFVIPVVNAGAATVAVFSADAPFKFRIIDAWAVSTKAANAGTWKLDNGTNDITTAIAYDTSDTLIARAAAIDDAYHDIAASGSLRLISSNAADTAIVYVSAIRVD